MNPIPSQFYCEGHCVNMDGTCPLVKPYADGAKRRFHSEVRCNRCHERSLWGLSWNGSKDGLFLCDPCREFIRQNARDMEIKATKEHDL